MVATICGTSLGKWYEDDLLLSVSVRWNLQLPEDPVTSDRYARFISTALDKSNRIRYSRNELARPTVIAVFSARGREKRHSICIKRAVEEFDGGQWGIRCSPIFGERSPSRAIKTVINFFFSPVAKSGLSAEAIFTQSWIDIRSEEEFPRNRKWFWHGNKKVHYSFSERPGQGWRRQNQVPSS